MTADWTGAEDAWRIVAARLAAADRENAELRNSLEACRNAGESIRTELDDARELNHGLTSRLLSAGNEKGRLQRENAELRGEVERHEVFMRAIKDCRDDPARAIAQNDIINGKAIIAAHVAEAERDDLRAQLAAAQAQLAEAHRGLEMTDAELDGTRRRAEAAEARLEAVRALRSRWEAERTYLNAEQEPIAAAYIELLNAALSAAPQPEPVVAPYETPEEAAANDAIPAEPISPEFRQRLIAAVERPLRVRRAILLLAGHASGHLPGFDRGCRVCRRDWPCEDTQRAAAPALEAFADVTPEPPASDEPTGRSD